MRLFPLHNKLACPSPPPTTLKLHVTPSFHSPSTLSLRTSTNTSDASVATRMPPQPPRHPQKQYSPKNWESSFLGPIDRADGPTRLGRRWPDYQGAQNWDGLLNPLDDNLRSEILRYGNFVEAAYRSFDFDPSSPSYATCRFSKRELLGRAGFPATGYRLTKNLRATSGIQMPRWTEKAASWATVQSSWIGYVAVCTDKAEIQRLGRRDVVIALRGTATCLEWLENFRATLTRLPPAGADDESGDRAAMVESGFLSLYTSATATCPSLQEMLRSEIRRILETYRGEEVSLTITGHSLGAALATLAAYDVKTEFKELAPLVTVISFGGPRVGNKSFRCHVEGQGTKILRIVNPGDVITKMPGFVIDDADDVRRGEIGSNYEREFGWAKGWRPGEWFQKRVEDTQWAYAEVGHELRLTTEPRDEERLLPPYLGNMNLAKCHELKTYLSLVGSSVGTTSWPLRETAKRFLHKEHANAL